MQRPWCALVLHMHLLAHSYKHEAYHMEGRPTVLGDHDCCPGVCMHTGRLHSSSSLAGFEFQLQSKRLVHVLSCDATLCCCVSLRSQAQLHSLACRPVLHPRLHLMAHGLTLGMQNVVDTSGGCGASFSLEVVSPEFEGT